MKLMYIFLLIILLFILYKLIKGYGFNAILTILASLLIIYIIANPKECMGFTIDGVKLFFNSVFPSLFPFLVLINMIISFGGIQIYSKILGKIISYPLGLSKNCSLAILISTFCGYPLGARYSSDIYERNLIDFKTYERLLNIASNGSPLFIIGAVGTAMLGNIYMGYLLLLSNFLSCIAMGLILPNRYKNNNSTSSKNVFVYGNNLNIGVAFKNSIEDAIKNALSIGGFIVIFSVIINIIKGNVLFNITLEKISALTTIPFEVIQGLILGMIEITNGCSIITKSSIDLNTKLLLLSFLITFSGLSITSQVYSLVYKFKVSMKKYLFYKTIQGAISSLITLLLCKLPLFNFSQETFLQNGYYNINSSQIYLIVILVILFPLIVTKIES